MATQIIYWYWILAVSFSLSSLLTLHLKTFSIADEALDSLDIYHPATIPHIINSCISWVVVIIALFPLALFCVLFAYEKLLDRMCTMEIKNRLYKYYAQGGE